MCNTDLRAAWMHHDNRYDNEMVDSKMKLNGKWILRHHALEFAL